MIDTTKLTTYSEFTPSQLKAIHSFTEWWKRPFSIEDHAYALIGSAGTGKTYLMNTLLQTVIDKACCITAPTHKALRVLERRCGRRGRTLQALHGLRPNTDMETFDIQNPQFDPRGVVHMAKYNLIIIDEASMINTDLYELNKKRAEEYKVKILYVGDAWQLPPVNEQVSRAFMVKDRSVLTDIVRQDSENPLIPLFNILRDDIKNNTNFLIKELIKCRENIVDGKGYKLYNQNDFANAVKVYYEDPQFYQNVEYIRIAAYTNKRIDYWNNFIRKIIVGETDKLITINDLFNANVTLMDEFNAPIIINSEDYIVNSVEDMITSEGIKCFVVVFQSCFDGRKTNPLLVLDSNHSDSLILYTKIANGLFNTAIKTKNNKMWQAFFEFRRRIITLCPIQIGYKTVKQDMSYGYALTTHRLQGSTLSNVAVDLVDIFFPTSRNGRKMVNERRFANQLAYVALSRTENIALIQY